VFGYQVTLTATGMEFGLLPIVRSHWSRDRRTSGECANQRLPCCSRRRQAFCAFAGSHHFRVSSGATWRASQALLL
jgi:hypothetical protein